MITKLINLAEKGLLPDFIVRYGIRTLLTKRLKSLIHTDQHTNKNNKENKRFLTNSILRKKCVD